MELDFIQRETPYGLDAIGSKRTLYKIKDPFLRFWFELVAPKRSLLSQTKTVTRQNLLRKVLPRLFSITWEELCRQAVPFIEWGNEIFGEAGRFWHGDGPEWDILTLSADGTTLLIGEAKWISKIPSSTFIYKTIQDMKNKGVPPIRRSPNIKIMYVVFVPTKPKNLKLPKDVKVIDAREVVRSFR
jgi:AAA+ ATPase superfamily predicted ATPase